MKLIAGHRYLKAKAGNEVVAYTEQMAKTLKIDDEHSAWVEFIAAETTSNEMQLPENEKVVARKAIPAQVKQEVEVEEVVEKAIPVMKVSLAKPVAKPVQVAKPAAKPVAPVVKKMQHMDIRSDMAADLAVLDQ